MFWLERLGYVAVALIFSAFIIAFTFPVDDLISADNVKIVPASNSVLAIDKTRLVKFLVNPETQVKAGDPIAQVVVGAESIDAWLGKRALERQFGRDSSLAAQIPEPTVVVLRAEGPGTVLYPKNSIEVTVEPKVELFRIVNYSDLRMHAPLAGQTVALATIGATARVSRLMAQSESGVLMRGRHRGDAFISGMLLNRDLRESLTQSLSKNSISLRDDKRFEVEEVTELAVDGDVSVSEGDSSYNSINMEPNPIDKLTAQVVSGKHLALIQISEIPSNAKSEIVGQIGGQLQNRNIKTSDGKFLKISGMTNVSLVAKVKAHAGSNGESATSLPGTILSRSYEAELKILAPSQSLIQAVKQADLSGRSVTARVEVRTGQRPLALLLLKKS